MKYLKTYSQRELHCESIIDDNSHHLSYENRVLPQQMVDEINDILLELTDIGYKCIIMKHGNLKKYTYCVISDTSRMFATIDLGKEKYTTIIEREEVREVVERIKDYMSQVGYKINLNAGVSTCGIIFIKNNPKTFEAVKSFGIPHLDYVELPQPIIDELKDICLELTDGGFSLTVEKPKTALNIFRGRGGYHNDDDDFLYTQEMDDVIQRIKEYIGMCGFAPHVYVQNFTGDYESELEIGQVYYDMIIYFTKK